MRAERFHIHAKQAFASIVQLCCEKILRSEHSAVPSKESTDLLDYRYLKYN